MTPSYVFTGGRVLDAAEGTLREGLDVLVTGDRIAAVGAGLALPENCDSIGVGGRTIMPGLIDCHVHVVAESLDLWSNMTAPASLAALRAARVKDEALQRGFTTLRDLGGADYGLVRAVNEGVIAGPRLVICGKGMPTCARVAMTGRACSRIGWARWGLSLMALTMFAPPAAP